MKICFVFIKPVLFLSFLLFCSCSKSENHCPEQALEPDPGPCRAAIIKYYFDQNEGECKEFIWGGCDGVVPFETLEDCKSCIES